MEFKDVLKKLRKNKGISQVELATKLGFSKSLIGLYETGERKPSFEALEAIADFFNISIDYLMGKEDKSSYYLDPEAAEIAQEMYDRPELKTLFSTTRNVKKEDIQFIQEMVDRIAKDKNGPDDDPA